MGHSLTSFGGKHVESRDFKIKVWLHLIVDAIDGMETRPDWLVLARSQWDEEARVAINGCMSPRLDEILDKPQKIELFKGLCEQVLARLEGFGERVPKEFLNELCGYRKPHEIREDNDTEIYLVYGRALTALLNGDQVENLVQV